MPLPQGLYDLLITPEVREQLADAGLTRIRDLKGTERRLRLIADLAKRVADQLEDRAPEDEETPAPELALLNQLLAELPDAPPAWQEPVQALLSVGPQSQTVEPPDTGLHHPWLFTNGRGGPQLRTELRAELSSTDQVDILISFITWSGIRQLEDLFKNATATGADGQPRTRFRILTTTYTGATEEKAITWLARLPGVSLRISLDGRRTRLHAKAWIFRRASGFGSAYVGSANLSGAALTGGLEWTIKVTQSGQRDVYEKSVAHFETLWADPEFQSYDPADPTHVQRLREALSREKRGPQDHLTQTPCLTTWFDIQPKPFQQIMLDRLAHERLHGRHRNLLVSATGTGKTVIAALDYRQLCQQLGGRPRLLFVAHRQEILQQALATYRHVLRDPGFGKLMTGACDPDSKEHLFTTIQSALSRQVLANYGVDYWRIVVVDECHHIAAASFREFVTHVQPQFLLGLTATPERGDGESIQFAFDTRPDGSPAAELRLWDALDQQLLAPFEYYGIHDATDFSAVPWGRTQLEREALNVIVLRNERRAKIISDTVYNYVDDPQQMRALGFCVSVDHARQMAEHFTRQGIPSATAHGGLTPLERDTIRLRLEQGEIRAIFSCDLYNEGIDLPFVNTLLLLRPTDSPLVFTQQLGRGLRLWPNKPNCLVLDFIGQYGKQFRFDRLWGSLTGMTRRELAQAMDHQFPHLPPGCVVQFDRKSREVVLKNLRESVNQRWSQLVQELRAYHFTRQGKPYGLPDFLYDQHIELTDLYRPTVPSGWTMLRAAADLHDESWTTNGLQMAKRLPSLLHHNDPGYLRFLESLSVNSSYLLHESERRRWLMLGYQLLTKDPITMAQVRETLTAHPALRLELNQLAGILLDQSLICGQPLTGWLAHSPLCLHGRYTRAEILAAVGKHQDGHRAHNREGVLRLAEEKTELMFVTLDKTEGFHDRIAYRDYAISPRRFHWQTQNAAGPTTKAGLQYLESPGNDWQFFLFVRQNADSAYHALGAVTPLSIRGDRPMSIVWELQQDMPVALFQEFSVLRG
jgi:superfamily II DNA or RNA helicase/HKD family nuclease